MSAPMVRASLRDVDPKEQTRRVVKGQALQWLEQECFTPEFVALPANGLCPYGKPGDRLWVRETYWAFGRWIRRHSAEKGRDEWHFVDMTTESSASYHYDADGLDDGASRGYRLGAMPAWFRRPGIFMPRAASRITLEITGVRVERLQDISEADALAEGVALHDDGKFTNYLSATGYAANAVSSYRSLWESINGPGSWDANPWVWVIEFRRLP